MRLRLVYSLMLALALLFSGCGTDSQSGSQTDPLCETSYTLLRRDGGRLDWSKATGQIAFDSAKLPEALENGAHQVYTMDSDGNDVTCVSCGLFASGLTVGQPAWGPDGRWLAVQVSIEGCALPELLTHPGSGFASELWAIDTETGSTTRLESADCALDSGNLHPHFSEDGTKFIWGATKQSINVSDPALSFGAWEMKVADVVWGEDGPSLENVETYVPGIEGFYETHSLDSSNRYLVHTATNPTNPGFQQTTLNELDLETGELTVLATGGFNEHGAYTADESAVIYMGDPERTVELARAGFRNNDIWVVRRDGEGAEKVTTFNVEGEFPLDIPGHPSDDYTYATTDLAMGPDPCSIITVVNANPGTAGPIADSDPSVEPWIVRISSPKFAPF